jgi:hemerythrin-like domain-containing protein
VELQIVKSEILTYREIIKVLQEELYKKELLNKAGSSDCNDDYNDCYVDQIKAHLPKEDWVQSIERKPESDNYSNSNLIQIIPTSDNTNEMLSNLREVEIIKRLSKDAETHRYLAMSKRKPVKTRRWKNRTKHSYKKQCNKMPAGLRQ